MVAADAATADSAVDATKPNTSPRIFTLPFEMPEKSRRRAAMLAGGWIWTTPT
jgi:hypothetical protein